MSLVFEASGVGFRRDGRQILSGVDFGVGAGENWVLLGPNGIGKSTLVSMMATRLFPSEGEVAVFGRELGTFDVFDVRRRIGVCSADLDSQFPRSATALEVVLSALAGATSFWGTRYGLNAGDDSRDVFDDGSRGRALELLDKFGVGHLASKEWGAFSQGERKRVSLARALMTDPDLLLLDEPTAGLDLAAREFVILTLNELAASFNKSSRAIVLVTHNVEEIPPAFDKVAIMAPTDSSKLTGTVKFQGAIADVLTGANLSEAYSMYLQISKQPNLRYFASASVRF